MGRIIFDGKNLCFSSENISVNLKEGTVIHGDFIISAESINLLRVALSDKPVYYVATCSMSEFHRSFHCVYSNEEIDEILKSDIDRMSVDIDLYRDKLRKAEMRIELLEDYIDRHNEGGWIERLFNKIHKE